MGVSDTSRMMRLGTLFRALLDTPDRGISQGESNVTRTNEVIGTKETAEKHLTNDPRCSLEGHKGNGISTISV